MAYIPSTPSLLRNASLAADRQLLENDSDANLYAVRNRNADVTFMAATTTIDADAPAFVDHVEYSAASKQDITFRFVAGNTAIKGGTLSFRIPNGWTTPIPVDADVTVIKDGETGATIDADGTDGDAATFLLIRQRLLQGVQSLLRSTRYPRGGIIDVLYSNAVVQPNADTVDIIGEFKTTSSARSRRAGRVEVEVTNVADGSGSATMSTGIQSRLYC